MTDPKERRSHSRTDVRLTAGMRRAEGGEPLAVTTVNLGAGGVYVEVPHFIEPLTKLEIALDLPAPAGNTRIEAEAIVVRTFPEQETAGTGRYRVACAFLALSDEHRTLLQTWVAAHHSSATRPA
jgi:hypothetical protein